MGKKYVCPCCGGTEFFVDVPVLQRWRLNQNGIRIGTEDPWKQTLNLPGYGETVECAKCGHEAKFVAEETA